MELPSFKGLGQLIPDYSREQHQGQANKRYLHAGLEIRLVPSANLQELQV